MVLSDHEGTGVYGGVPAQAAATVTTKGSESRLSEKNKYMSGTLSMMLRGRQASMYCRVPSRELVEVGTLNL